MSPKSHQKYIAVIVVLLLINLYLTASYRSQIDALKQETNNQYNRLSQDITLVYNSVNALTREMETSAEEAASLFTDYNMTLAPAGSEIIANITAIPKALATNSKVIVSLATDQETFEAELDEQGNATLSIPITQKVTPTLKILSPDRVQTEVKAPLLTSELFDIPLETRWLDEPNENGTLALSATIINRKDKAILSADTIETGYFIRVPLSSTSDSSSIDPTEELKNKEELMRKTNNKDDNAKSDLLKTLQETGTIIPTTMMSNNDGKEVVFKAQAPVEITGSESASYYFIFVVDTKDGMTYMSSLMNAPTYEISPNSSGASSGSDILSPIFTK